MTWPAGVVVRAGERLARHSPWRVGGACDAFVVVHARDALGPALAAVREAGWSRALVGAGTRTVFRDGGVAGAVVRLGAGFARVEARDGGWSAGASAPLAGLPTWSGAPAAWAALARAPGSLGASLVCDEGWEPWVDAVCVHARGAERWVELAELRARGGQAIVTEVRLRRGADAAPPDVGLPTSWYLPGKGSRFAELRRLLRRSALGDVRLRDVAVPSVCPELLVNLGDATAKDLALVHRSVVERVHQVTGLELGDRMRWVGRPS